MRVRRAVPRLLNLRDFPGLSLSLSRAFSTRAYNTYIYIFFFFPSHSHNLCAVKDLCVVNPPRTAGMRVNSTIDVVGEIAAKKHKL